MIPKHENHVHGVRRYAVRFQTGRPPPIDGFWSLSLNGTDFNFVEDPINRYSIGERPRGFKFGADGSLTINVQTSVPDADSNWLSTPEGPFLVI